MPYLLLSKFRSLFKGIEYRHRDLSLGDSVASYVPEDLYNLNRSPKFNALIDTGERVSNLRNILTGIKSRRGDGTFGEAVPNSKTTAIPGLVVRGGHVATVEIGTEVKILAKSMIKQIDRVVSDMTRQVEHFRTAGGSPICIGIAGINFADRYTSYEGEKVWVTDGKKYKHPVQEAAEAERRLLSRAAPAFDEFLVLRFRAVNEPPFPFAWLKDDEMSLNYGAALTRILRKYEVRFLR